MILEFHGSSINEFWGFQIKKMVICGIMSDN